MEINYPSTENSAFNAVIYNPMATTASAGIASAEDYAVCRQIMRAASKNYSSASNYLPQDKLPHVEALYALMRVGDDRVDVSHSGFSTALEAIDDWEREYRRAFESGSSPHPVLRAYLNTAMTFGIPEETMTAYFRAMRDDLKCVRFPTFSELLYYMDGSAIPVGRAMTYILGVAQPFTIANAIPGADHLSIAMQMSNFWRDIGEDWRRGRIYLPQEDMEFFRVSEADLEAHHVTSNFIHLLEFEFERTEMHYESARSSVRMLASGQVAVMSALEIYRAILDGIRANRYDVFNQRAGTGKLRKISLVAKAYLQVR
jgi:15-cis-phytoene synthase